MALRLPYFAVVSSLPAALPTEHEIESTKDIRREKTGSKVVGVGPQFVVKYRVQVEPLEGETNLFLAQSTAIPVPQVYAIFQTPFKSIKTTFIVMERIHGSTLASLWPAMDTTTKAALASQLRTVFADIRTLPSPGGYCSTGRQGLPEGIFWTNEASRPFAGPFDTEANFMVAKYVEDGLSKHKAKYYARTFAAVLKDHGPVFSHGDFQRKNVMMRDRGAEGNETASELVFIDWEFAGWYPSYWEYARTIFACGRWDNDWNDLVDKVLVPHRNEYAWIEMLLRELWS